MGSLLPCKDLKIYVQFWYLEGDEAFICAVQGMITGEIISDIEQKANDNISEIFLDGDGDYLFIATHQEGQQSFPETGQWDFPPHWELDQIFYQPCDTEGE